jgi:hypothetical protein
MKKIRLLLLLTLGLGGVVLSGPAQQSQNQLDVAFAFSDGTGTRLLAVDDSANPQHLANAIFPGGIIQNVKFLRRQQRAVDWNGRQTAHNFDRTPGLLFEIENGKAPSRRESGIGESCLLVSKRFLQDRRQLPVKSEPGIPASSEVIRRIEKSKGKSIDWAKSIANIGDGRDLLLVRFVPEGEKAVLASLVLVTADSLSFDDHEAKFDKDAKAFVWRVDTDGIDPESFHVLAAFEGKQGIEIGILWNAFEGQNFFILRSQESILRPVYTSYRYWTPI